MNYIKELNAFYDWLETNSLSTSAIALWHALMHINNKAGWAEEFGVAASVLCVKTGLADRTIRNARNELKQKGRIDWSSRKGNQSAMYKIISLLDTLPATVTGKPSGNDIKKDEEKALSEINADNVSDNHADKCADSSAGNHATLNKLNETKLNYININTTESEENIFDDEFSELAKLYQNCIGQANAFTSEWINFNKNTYGFQWVKNALLEAERQGIRTKSYVEKILSNWKNWGGMKLSTDKNINQTKISPAKKTKFHNFEGRTEKYTAEQLDDIAERKRREYSERLKKQNEAL